MGKILIITSNWLQKRYLKHWRFFYSLWVCVCTCKSCESGNFARIHTNEPGNYWETVLRLHVQRCLSTIIHIQSWFPMKNKMFPISRYFASHDTHWHRISIFYLFPVYTVKFLWRHTLIVLLIHLTRVSGYYLISHFSKSSSPCIRLRLLYSPFC